MPSKHWKPATATVLMVHILRVGGDGLTPTREWAVEVTTGDGAVRRTRLGEPRWVIDFWPPDAGDVVRVLVHDRTGAVRFDLSDPQLSARARARREAAAFAALLRNPHDPKG